MARKWQPPEGWPEGLPGPVFITVRPGREGLSLVPLSDGRFTLPELSMEVDPGDGRVIEVDVRVVDGQAKAHRIAIRDDDDGLPLSTLRHYPVGEYVENGVGQYTIGPTDGSNVELSLEPVSSATRAVARKAVRRRTTPELLRRVTDLYRKAGGGTAGVTAVADELSYDPRHARRLRDKAVESGLLEAGE